MNRTDPAMALLAACGGDTVKLFDVSVNTGDPCILSCTPLQGSQVNCVKWNHTNLVVASAGDDKRISLTPKNGQSMGTVGNGDNIEESILSVNFTTKASRYISSGGSGQVVRIWDLQKKRCVKWLKGHTDTITGVQYNCKDEHLASISLGGDLIVHNLASGARAAELKDPNGQVLRVLDYSRVSRHLLVTAGDDGSIHLWDTTGRSPKVSWLKQHSAPTVGISFSPSNDKVIASVGLDKKLYTFDSGTKRPSFCVPCEAPFSSVAFRDDGYTLAAGTSGGQVVFYDVRGKPQPFTVLHAYGNSETVTNLCWQRSKPIFVNEKNCTEDMALLGGAVDDSILMPDPLPPATTSSHSTTSSAAGEETPLGRPGGSLSRLHAPHGYNFKDDMEVFSPLVEVQPFTPSLWNGTKKDFDKMSPLLFPSSRRPPLDSPLIFDSTSTQDDKRTTSSKTDELSPPEAWGGGGERLLNKLSRFATTTSSGLSSDSMQSGLVDVSLPSTSCSLSLANLGIGEDDPCTYPKDVANASPSTQPQRFSTYAERMSTNLSLGDSTSLAVTNKTEEELSASFSSKSEILAATESTKPPSSNGMDAKGQQGTPFSLQLFQGTLEEGLGSFQKSIHEDIRNLHIEVVRQFHLQETQVSNAMGLLLENQQELIKEIQSLRKENQQLRHLL